jgi:aldehyde dehydrogenase (NAD+)
MQSSTDDTTGAGAEPTPPPPYEGWEAMPIGGAWRAGRSGKRRVDHDPYTGEVLVDIPLANAQDVDEAYRAAERVQPGWGAALPQDRQQVLARAAQILVRRKDEIMRWIVKESGGTRTKALLEWQLVYFGLLEAASYPSHVEGRILPAGIPGKESRVYRRPVGVVGVISPWNFPFQLSNRSVAPALAVGNAVVLKPASDTPVTGALLLAKIFEEAGLPPGVLSVVVGAGEDVGDAFVDHPVPRVISFTGSTPVGRRIGERAGRGIKRVCLELGGNGPFLVLADADVERAAQAAVNGKFMHQGQICMAVNRIIVDTRVYDAFLDAFAERTAALKVGDPDEPDTAIGPLINQAQCDRLRDIVERTVAEGARILLGGDGPRGLVFPPTILTGVTNQMAAAREELFGPVAPILRVDGDHEAVDVANDTEYGLSSAIFTRDVERGVRLALRIEAGMTHVNDVPVNDEPNTAFGGEKASGVGRFGGRWAIDEFTTDHWISVQHTPRSYPL